MATKGARNISMSSAGAHEAGHGLWNLLKTNAPYRRLWFAEFVSFVGDWFTLISLMQLVGEETGRKFAVGILFTVQMAPGLLLSSVAGRMADRFPRKHVMITCDWLRCAGALAFILPGVAGLSGTPFSVAMYGLVLFQHSVSAFFRPAASASVPSLVKPADLSSAGTLEGLAWSMGLIVGSALGGFAVAHLGTTACFLLDGGSFLLSAILLQSLPLRPAAATRTNSGFGDFGELFTELKRNRALIPPILAKCAWGIGAAQLFLLTNFGGRVFGAGAESEGFGLLYAARGIGTACGPALARRLLGDSDRAIARSIMFGFAAAAGFYFIFGLGAPLPVALFCIAGAHAGGSMIWIGATVLVQRKSPDSVRGRAFALEMALHTITAGAAPLLAAALCDRGVDPSTLVIGFSIGTAVLGLLWSALAIRFPN